MTSREILAALIGAGIAWYFARRMCGAKPRTAAAPAVGPAVDDDGPDSELAAPCCAGCASGGHCNGSGGKAIGYQIWDETGWRAVDRSTTPPKGPVKPRDRSSGLSRTGGILGGPAAR